jgi:glycosyltransferase involved in cell wall biosynthesis
MKLNLQCPLGTTGYGITSVNILKGLHNLGVDISLFPMSTQNIQLNNDIEKAIVQETYGNAQNFDYKAPCLKIWHQFDLAQRIGSGPYFSHVFFEVDQLTDQERVHLNSCDGIFVSSEWAKQVLIDNGVVKPVYVAPLAVDLDIFKDERRIKIEDPQQPYVFFHIGKWETRKAHDFLIQCFNNTFSQTDNVELWLLPANPFLNAEETAQWENLVKLSPLQKKIKIFERLPTQHHLAQYISLGHCGVFLSRAEGWNNSILESMALNKPIIATNYSAHTQYCTKDNSFLVDIDELEVANDGKWFFGTGKWAKLGEKQFQQTKQYMRHCYENRIVYNAHGLGTCKKFTWENTAKIIKETIEKCQ